jgi:RHS repeat-associated protein
VTTYFLHDGLGSTTGLTDDEGSVTDTYTYDVFEAMKSHTGSSANAWRFTGELNDPTVGRAPYYLRARYYDPALGRFLTRDPWPANPMNPQSLNRYPYVWNNPALYVDPYGYWGGPLGKIGGAIADKAGDAAEWISDPSNIDKIATGAQIVSGVLLPYACSNPAACAVVGGVYVTATGVKFYLADNAPERLVILGTATIGVCGAFAEKPISLSLNVASNILDATTSAPGVVEAPTSASSRRGTVGARDLACATNGEK